MIEEGKKGIRGPRSTKPVCVVCSDQACRVWFKVMVWNLFRGSEMNIWNFKFGFKVFVFIDGHSRASDKMWGCIDVVCLP